jgi:AcrR family transcriptional regulator
MMRCAHDATDAAGPGPYFSAFVEGRRGQILDAALAIFAEKGYEGGTMREIATRVGVTEPALYRHYAGKEALFEDLVAVAGDHIAERAASGMQLISPETIRESLSVIMESRRNHVRDENSSRSVIGILMMAAPHNGTIREVFGKHILRPMVSQLATILPPVDAYFGIQRTPEEAADRVRALISLFVGSFMTAMMFGDVGEEDDEATVNAMIAMMGWNAPAA